MKKLILSLFMALVCQLATVNYLNAQTGTWTKLTNAAPHENMGVMLLLTNGNVICHDTVGGTVGAGWDMLTPDASGSYVNGTWSTIASMKYDRFAFSSQVLPNGNVWVAGGEYGAGDTASEIYNPFTNVWSSVSGIPTTGSDVAWNVYDAPSELLYTGTVLDGPEIGVDPSFDCLFYTPSTDRITVAPTAPLNHDEAQWIKLPDSSVLFIGIANDTSCRYIPQINAWIKDAVTPEEIYDTYGEESGCGMMLPNGKAIFFGANQYNVLYTPTGNHNPGTWTAAANFPQIQGSYVGQPDAPGAMMVNGHMLLAVSPIGTSFRDEFKTPTYFLEYDYTTNTFTQVTSPLPNFGGDSIPIAYSQFVTFLDLPDGNVLVGLDQCSSYSTSYMIYTPGSGPIPQGKPTINSILPDGCPSYKLTGKLFNGISEGSSFGDDLQNSTNYPIIRLTNGTNVYYATTTNWNRIGAVQTDSLEDTTVFTVPNIPAGTYSLVVIANGFASSPTLFSVFGISSLTSTNANCSGSSGSATVTNSGGLTPYTYSWSNGATTSSITNLSAGTYTITTSDNNACSATASVTITQSGNGLTVSATVTANATCSAGGSDSASVSGGVSPYTYMWSDANSQTTVTATGLSAGTYTITVTDNSGCSGTASSIITQSGSSIVVTSNVITNAQCSQGGSDSASVSGGVSPYTYLWSDANSQTTVTATGLSAGTYTITVTDNSGCSGTASATITQSSGSVVVSTTSIANAHCAIGGSDSASASGGTSPYTYLWSDAASQTTAVATGLSVGTYTITVTDQIGCSATTTGVITEGVSTLAVSAIVTANANCAIGGSDSAAVSGGVSPYTYLWSDATSQSTINATGLSAGTYTITVTDSAGCSATATNVITQPTVLNLAISVTSYVTCNGGSNGSDSVSVSGGVSPYTYLWNDANSQSTATATGLSAGTYAVLVTDSNGCYGTISNTITQPGVLTGSAGVTTNDNCNGGSTGSATASTSAGTSPYTYLWSDGASQSTAVATGLSAGSYTVTMNDSCGASVTAAVIITQPAPLSVSATGSGSVCSGNNGNASASASGGTQPYTYLWSDGGSQTTANASGLTTGTYTVTVSDNCGASVTASATVIQSAPLTITASGTASGCNTNNGSATVSATGGTSPYTYSWSSGSGSGASISGLSGGTYIITVSDSCGTQATASVTIVQSVVTITIASRVIEVCNGIGYITAHGATGGVSPYTYSWAPSGGTNLETSTDLGAGTYTITATDNNGCSGTASESITLPPQLTLSANSTAGVTCYGGNNGSAAATAGGGTTPYTYSWFPGGGNNSTAGGLSAGNYMITVTDSNGCAVTANVVITQPAGMVITQDSVDQNGNCDGEAAVTVVSGGIAPYTYSWTGGLTTDTIKGLCAGSYCCTITGNNGCSQTTCITVNNATGIDNIAAGTGPINVYPNPTNGIFTLELATAGGQSTLEIYNMLGQEITSELLIKKSNLIDLSAEPSGIYLFRVIKSNGSLEGDGKIIIQK